MSNGEHTTQLPPPQPADVVITTHGLSKTFGSQAALDDINLTVPRGSIIGLIGPSGCGKTTLVRTLIGVLPPTSGEVRVFGKDPAQFSVRDRGRFGYMPQLPVLFPNLSLSGNLNFIASVYGVPLRGRRKRLNRLLDLVDLGPHRKKKLAQCSGGMQRRLTLAATLVHDPELLYLDEPTAGVDPILRERFWAHFRDLRDQGHTIVVPTQYVSEATSCDLVAVMVKGQLVTLQPPSSLQRFAFGGDVVNVPLLGGWLQHGELDELARLPFVRSVRRMEDGLLVVVDDVAEIPALSQHFAMRGITTGEITPAEPTVEEVFVELVEGHIRDNEREVVPA